MTLDSNQNLILNDLAVFQVKHIHTVSFRYVNVVITNYEELMECAFKLYKLYMQITRHVPLRRYKLVNIRYFDKGITYGLSLLKYHLQ